MATTVEESIEVSAPLSAVYNQWTQFEEFPHFMGGVQSVQQLTDTRLHWVAEIAGVRREWDAEVLQQVPDQKVAWAATEGATNAGQVTFASLGPLSTRVTLHLEYEPEGLVESIGDKLNFVQRQATSDLQKFKAYIEERGVATGGWRGGVNESADVGRVGVDAAADTEGDSGKAGISPKVAVAGAAVAAAGVAAAAAAAKSGSSESEQDVESVKAVRPEPEIEVEPVVVVEETAAPLDPAPVGPVGTDEEPGMDSGTSLR